jgi:hypothetical protein
VGSDDLDATPVWFPPDDPAVRVTALHGTAFGDRTNQGLERRVRFRTLSDGVTIDREVQMIVSPIAASVYGSDDEGTPGTTEKPFRSFAKAAAAADDGDTIFLSNGPNGMEADGMNAADITLRSGVTVHGRDVGGTRLYMKLHLLGNATLEGLYFFTSGQRLVITAPGSHVVLRDCLTAAGVEVDAKAVGAKLEISGGVTEIRADDGLHAPLLVAADGASLTVDTPQSKVSFTGKERTDDATMMPIRMTGQDQRLTIQGGVLVRNFTGPTAISVEGKTDVVVTGATVQGLVDIRHALATGKVLNSELSMAQGEGGIRFRGQRLEVRDSRFKANGIEQDNALSEVTVRGTTFTKYSRFAYHLIAGHADLGDGMDAGGNQFLLPPPADPNAVFPALDAPYALINDAPATTEDGMMTNNFITVSAANYNFPAKLPDLPCTMTGTTQPPLFKLANGAQLYFFN